MIGTFLFISSRKRSTQWREFEHEFLHILTSVSHAPGPQKIREHVILKVCDSLRTLSKNQVGQKAQITLVDSSPRNLGVNGIIEEIFYRTKFL